MNALSELFDLSRPENLIFAGKMPKQSFGLQSNSIWQLRILAELLQKLFSLNHGSRSFGRHRHFNISEDVSWVRAIILAFTRIQKDETRPKPGFRYCQLSKRDICLGTVEPETNLNRMVSKMRLLSNPRVAAS